MEATRSFPRRATRCLFAATGCSSSLSSSIYHFKGHFQHWLAMRGQKDMRPRKRLPLLLLSRLTCVMGRDVAIERERRGMCEESDAREGAKIDPNERFWRMRTKRVSCCYSSRVHVRRLFRATSARPAAAGAAPALGGTHTSQVHSKKKCLRRKARRLSLGHLMST